LLYLYLKDISIVANYVSPWSGGGIAFVQLVPFHGTRRLVVTSKHPSTWILSWASL